MPIRWKSENHLHQYGGEIRRASADIVGKGVFDLQARTQVDSPVDTGRLKTGWQAVLPGDTGPVEGGVGTNVEYAAYVELGTGQAGAASQYPFPRVARYTPTWPGMRARAMLGNAAQAVLPSVKDALGRLGGRMRQL